MIRITFKEPQTFDIGKETEFTCLFVDALKIFRSKHLNWHQCVIRYGTSLYDVYFLRHEKKTI